MHPKEKIVHDILKQLTPDRDALLKLISSQITEEILIDIANADYGWNAEKNLIALKSIKETGIIPTNKELDYDVLSLSRYIEPEEHPKLDIHALHVRRVFCCAISLIANSFSSDDYYNFLAENESDILTRLIESVNYLGNDFQLKLISFLAWDLNSDSLNSFFYKDDVTNKVDIDNIIPIVPFMYLVLKVFALIYLVLKTSYSITENNLKILVECLIEGAGTVEDCYKASPDGHKGCSAEFLGVFNLEYEDVYRYPKWIQFGKEIPVLIAHLKDQELKNQLKKISELISKNEHLYKKIS